MLLSCITCQEIFKDRSQLRYHVRQVHQSRVKVTFPDGKTVNIKGGSNGLFECVCHKSFPLPDSLRRHTKSCNDDRGTMEMGIASMSMEGNEGSVTEGDDGEDLPIGRLVNDLPFDCIGNSL